MLIEFSVSNFRSVHGRQSLSMVPGSSREARNRFSHKTKLKNLPHVLRVAGVFGPNGSGKSTLVRALDFMQDFVVDSARAGQEGDLIDVTPFLYGEEDATDQSEFEAVFLVDGIRYQYGFVVSPSRVHAEWLYVVPSSGRMQRWFERTFDVGASETNWYINPSIKGEKEVWRKSTRYNALFLSSAMQLNADVFHPVFDWFKSKLKVITSSQRLTPSFTVKECSREDKKRQILKVLEEVDTGIVDFDISEKEITEDAIIEGVSEDVKREIIKRMKGHKLFDVKTCRNVEQRGPVFMPMAEESDGTQVLFALAGPWMDVLEHGYTLIVDELSNSLHPLAFHYLVSLVNDASNKSGAQLIFTSHDTSIMLGKKLHQDQINLIQRNSRYETEVRALSDFEVRNDEAIQRGYLGGRYGALPFIDVELV